MRHESGKSRVKVAGSGLGHVFRALSSRNYRLFFSGQIFSLVGTWMQTIAMSWMVYRLTGSAFLLGFISFLNQAPSIFLTPFGGVIADRFDRRKLLLFTQAASMLQALLLAFLTLTSTANVWNISILSFFLGLVNAIDAPVRQAYVVHLVDEKNDLGNAIALNSAMFNAARLIGPAIAGLVIAAVGEGICFAANGLSYVAVIAALLAIRSHSPHTSGREKARVLAHLREGVSYSYRSVPIRYLILMMALVSFIGMSYAVMMPVLAKDVLRGGSHTLGFLMSSAGIGALIGAIYLASRKTVVGLLRSIPFSVVMMGAGIAGLSFSRWFLLSAALLFFIGLGMVLFMGACNTVIQTIVDEDKRGRVMSLYTLAFMGMAPLGSLLVGFLSGGIGIMTTLLVNGGFIIAGGIWFAVRLPAIRKAVRPVYERMGILPKPENEG